MAKKKTKVPFLSSFFALLTIVLSACSPKAALKKTNAFYINDSAGALLSSTRYYIYHYSKLLYEETNENASAISNKTNGTQIVVATKVGTEGVEFASDLLNAWGVGKNDMGLLLVLSFTPEGGFFNFNHMDVAIGDKMSTFLTAFTAEGLAQTYFDDPLIASSNYDLKLINYYFALMGEILDKAYGATSFNGASLVENYIEDEYEYFGHLMPSEKEPIAWWVWVVAILAIVLFGSSPLFYRLLFSLLGGGSNSGGGGRGRGYTFRR